MQTRQIVAILIILAGLGVILAVILNLKRRSASPTTEHPVNYKFEINCPNCTSKPSCIHCTPLGSESTDGIHMEGGITYTSSIDDLNLIKQKLQDYLSDYINNLELENITVEVAPYINYSEDLYEGFDINIGSDFDCSKLTISDHQAEHCNIRIQGEIGGDAIRPSSEKLIGYKPGDTDWDGSEINLNIYDFNVNISPECSEGWTPVNVCLDENNQVTNYSRTLSKPDSPSCVRWIEGPSAIYLPNNINYSLFGCEQDCTATSIPDGVTLSSGLKLSKQDFGTDFTCQSGYNIRSDVNSHASVCTNAGGPIRFLNSSNNTITNPCQEACRRPTDITGYNIQNETSLSSVPDNFNVSVECASQYNPSPRAVLPTATQCVAEGGEYSLSGCEEDCKSKIPDNYPHTGYVIVEGGWADSGLPHSLSRTNFNVSVECAPGYGSTSSGDLPHASVCTEAGGEYTYEGCVADCISPNMPGYVVENEASANFSSRADGPFFVNVSCADNFSAPAGATASRCSSPNNEYTVTGCYPDCTLDLVGPVKKKSLSDQSFGVIPLDYVYNISDIEPGVDIFNSGVGGSCKEGYIGEVETEICNYVDHARVGHPINNNYKITGCYPICAEGEECIDLIAEYDTDISETDFLNQVVNDMNSIHSDLSQNNITYLRKQRFGGKTIFEYQIKCLSDECNLILDSQSIGVGVRVDRKVVKSGTCGVNTEHTNLSLLTLTEEECRHEARELGSLPFAIIDTANNQRAQPLGCYSTAPTNAPDNPTNIYFNSGALLTQRYLKDAWMYPCRGADRTVDPSCICSINTWGNDLDAAIPESAEAHAGKKVWQAIYDMKNSVNREDVFFSNGVIRYAAQSPISIYQIISWFHFPSYNIKGLWTEDVSKFIHNLYGLKYIYIPEILKLVFIGGTWRNKTYIEAFHDQIRKDNWRWGDVSTWLQHMEENRGVLAATTTPAEKTYLQAYINNEDWMGRGSAALEWKDQQVTTPKWNHRGAEGALNADRSTYFDSDQPETI